MTLGRYELLRLVGCGSFAEVFSAHDPLLARDVALKVLLASLSASADDRQRFLAEARALAALHHPNIVTVYDVGDEGGRPFFAMELLQGKTLARIIHESEELSLERAIEIVTALASALDCVHSAGLVHRDVKDANVMFTDGGRVVLMDFGIVLPSVGTRLTEPGSGLGTAETAAPEQVRGDRVGPPADIYALGVLAYQMLSGSLPFSGDPAHVLYGHAHLTPRPLRDLRPGLPDRVYAAVGAALAKEPNARPESAGSFAAAFAETAVDYAAMHNATAESAASVIHLRGDGRSEPIAVRLKRGFTELRIHHSGARSGVFRVRLLDGDGNLLKQLVETSRPYTGTTAVTVLRTGHFALTIDAGGPWTVEIEHPHVASRPAVANATGSSDGVVYLSLSAGVRRLQIEHQVWQGSPFRATLLDSRGDHPVPLVATTGPYRGVVTRRIDRTGRFIVVIEAEGTWRVGVRE